MSRAKTKHKLGCRDFLDKKWPALAALVIFICFEIFLHDSTPMDWMREQAFKVVHHCLSLNSKQTIPVVIVDISNLKTKNVENNTNFDDVLQNFKWRSEYTPYEDLNKVISALANLQPAAIGIDIDFSPEFELKASPPPASKFQLLRNCNNLQTLSGVRIPVFLAVSRAAGRPPRAWLGNESLTNIAACGLRFPGSNIRMLSTLVCPPENHPLRSLSLALAESYFSAVKSEPMRAPPLLNWLFENDDAVPIKKSSNACIMTSFLVNYNFLTKLNDGKIMAETLLVPLSVNEHQNAKAVFEADFAKTFKNKVVLIGDAELGASYDVACIPGESEPWPGVYTHACAACTLIESPLQQIGIIPGLLISATVTIVLLIMNYLEWVGMLFSKPIAKHVRGLRLEILHNIVAVIIVASTAIVLAAIWHILWLNFISSCAVFCIEFYTVLYWNKEKET